jgi:hypothetical protein
MIYTDHQIVTAMLLTRTGKLSFSEPFWKLAIANHSELEPYINWHLNPFFHHIKFNEPFSGSSRQFWIAIRNFHDWDYFWKPNPVPTIIPPYPNSPPGITVSSVPWILSESGKNQLRAITFACDRAEKLKSQNLFADIHSLLKVSS